MRVLTVYFISRISDRSAESPSESKEHLPELPAVFYLWSICVFVNTAVIVENVIGVRHEIFLSEKCPSDCEISEERAFAAVSQTKGEVMNEAVVICGSRI